MSILSFNKKNKTCLRTLYSGRKLVRKKYSGNRNCGKFKDFFYGYTVPLGYQNTRYKKAEIQKQIKKANNESLFLYKKLHM